MARKIKLTFFQDFRDYLIITFGLLLYALGFTCFQLPYEITTGGLAGAGAVIFYATGFLVQYTFFMVNIILLAIALNVLGWKFCSSTTASTLRRVSSDTSGWSLSTRDTVVTPTPDSRAISLMVMGVPPFRPSILPLFCPPRKPYF